MPEKMKKGRLEEGKIERRENKSYHNKNYSDNSGAGVYLLVHVHVYVQMYMYKVSPKGWYYGALPPFSLVPHSLILKFMLKNTVL